MKSLYSLFQIPYLANQFYILTEYQVLLGKYGMLYKPALTKCCL